ncbi:hypothetical protein [Lacrimispora brassicae]
MKSIILSIILLFYLVQVPSFEQYPLPQKEVEWNINTEVGDNVYSVSYGDEGIPVFVQSDAILFLNGFPVAGTVKFLDGTYNIPINALNNFWNEVQVPDNEKVVLEEEEYFLFESFGEEEYSTGVLQKYEGYLPFVWIDKKVDINPPQYSIEQARCITYKYFIKNLANAELSAEYIESMGGPVTIEDFDYTGTVGNYYFITMPTMKAGFEQFDVVFNNVTGNLFYLSGSGGGLSTF